jgi:hypothetical protein
MTNHITFLLLIAYLGIIGSIDSNLKEFQEDCYQENIRLHIEDEFFKDTLLLFKNYLDTSDLKRIICNDFNVTDEISEEVWESKYLEIYLRYQEELKKFSIISFHQIDQNVVVVSYYLSDRMTKETLEMRRFKMIDGTIEGINPLPGIQDTFISTEEYDNAEIQFE